MYFQLNGLNYHTKHNLDYTPTFPDYCVVGQILFYYYIAFTKI